MYENDIWYEKANTQEWQKMMSRVKQGLSPTEETVVDSAIGTVMSSAGTGGSGSGDSGSKNSSSSSSLSGVKIAVKNGSGIRGCVNEAASKLTPQGAVCETGQRRRLQLQEDDRCIQRHRLQPSAEDRRLAGRWHC